LTQRIKYPKQLGCGSVEYLKDLGALNSRLFAAHAIWMAQHEIELIAKSGASIVHNPYSNLRLGSGYCPLPELRRAGVNIALGSDGGDSGDSYSIMDQARLASMLHRVSHQNPSQWISGEDAFSMATLGGANILTGGSTGNIAVGKLADIVIMKKDHRFFSLAPVARTLVHAGSGDIRHVIVNGNVVLENGNSVFYDEAADLEILESVTKRGATKLNQTVAIADRYRSLLHNKYVQSTIKIGSFQPGDAILEPYSE
jgi:5-methylthioadenosine/S-adenosylhomocysteine deaminase